MFMLFLAALAVRLPWLMDFPRFEDEGEEVIWALEIAEGQHFPVTAVDAYYGPFFSYLVAGLFWLFGVDIVWPRLMVAVFGALTVPAVYTLGRRVANHDAGLLAAVLTLTSPALVLISSHYGWSNSLTPFFATSTLIAIHAGLTRQRPWTMAIGGVLAGLTLQTHPLSLVLLVAIALWYCWSIPASLWFRKSETYAAVGGVLAGYSPMLWSFATTWEQFASSVDHQRYAYGPAFFTLPYFQRLPTLAGWLLLTMLGAAVILLPITLFLVIRNRRRFARDTSNRGSERPFISFILPVCLLLLPTLTLFFHPRYLTFLLPMVFVWMGTVFGEWNRRDLEHRPARRTTIAARMRYGWLLALVCADLVVAGGAMAYGERQAFTNDAFFDLRDTLKSRGGCHEGVFVESGDAANQSDAYAYFNARAVRLVLSLESCNPVMGEALELADALAQDPLPSWLVVAEGNLPVFGDRFHLERVETLSAGPQVADHLRLSLFRVSRGRP